MPAISTQNLKALPGVAQLKRLLQSLATLDAILSPDWEYRCYSFRSSWSESEQMGSMRNGSGDEFFALFNSTGCLLKGNAHESAMAPFRSQPPRIWPGVLEGVPECFSSGLNEPSFSMEETTFCLWRQQTDATWSHGPIKFPVGNDPDGSAALLAILDGKPETYCRYAEEYFEKTLTLTAVQHVYNHLPLTTEVLGSLNPDASLEEIENDLQAIGYPIK